MQQAKVHDNCRAEPLPLPSLVAALLSRLGKPYRTMPSADVALNIIERAQEGILVADLRTADGRIIYANAAFEAITGYSREEAIGKNCRYLQGSDRLQPEIGMMRDALASGSAIEVRLRNYRRNGTLFWNDLYLVPVTNTADRPTYYIGFIRDVTEAIATAAKLEQVMGRDQLTGCLDRDAFLERLSRRTASDHVLLVKVDVARFHEINGGYGYDVGDDLLRLTARRLLALEADLVARIGSDQFALAFAITGNAQVTDVLERLTRSLAERFALPGADFKSRFAVGFATGGLGANAKTLVRQAGAALADSKTSLLLRPREFVAEREAKANHRVRMTAELQRAILAKELIYYYQPQVDLASGRLAGAEALIRWQHALFGLQQPSRFIGLAEETGLITDIGSSGLWDVARFATELNRGRPEPLNLSFNVSSIELTHGDIVTLVLRVLEETGADPAWLTLELTESLLTDDSPEMLSIFHRMRDIGVGLSIDDFGTGYSSLRYIERFPLTEIKIDRSFISGLPQSSAKRVIVEAVIKLGSTLGARVVAEGVEQQIERDMLMLMGCSFAQGNLFSPPLTAEAFNTIAASSTDCRAFASSQTSIRSN